MRLSGAPNLMRVRRRIEASAASLAAKPIERPLPLGLEIDIEHQSRVGIDYQPCIILHLTIELTRRPAGVTERQPCLLGSASARHVLEDFERRGERQATVDQQGLV